MLRDDQRIHSKAMLRAWLADELPAYEKNMKPLGRVLMLNEASVLWKHQRLLRRLELAVNTNCKFSKIILRFRLNRLQMRYGMHIPVNVCAKGLKNMHVGPILINSKSTVGENCVFHINTALVAGGTDQDVPTLGQHVIMGIGSTIVGGVTIANDVAIGAGAVVTKDVNEKGVTVGGVPAHVISHNGSESWNHHREKAMSLQ